jgi:aryl-alcohol dehydrogenase-like predicted oxidoreductase
MFEREAEKEMLPFCQKHGVGFIPYFPLAGGFLTGKYKRGQDAPDGSRGESSPYVQRYMTDANYTVVEKLSAWSEARDRNMVQLAHAWLLAQPAVSSVISGATKVSQVEQNAKAGDWQLSAEELEEVNAVLGAA